MGADFCACGVPLCELTEERLTALRAVMADYTDKEIITIAEDWVSLDPDYLEELSEAGKAHVLRRHFVDRALESISYLDSRCASPIRFDGMDYAVLLTGGMTWGDAPTEAYETFMEVCAANKMWKLMQTFAREDYGKGAVYDGCL